MKKYKRILIKISGEALMGNNGFGIDMDVVDNIANQLVEISKKDIELTLVVGGGNIFRGLSISEKGMERASADYVGMLATVMNALVLQNSIEKLGVKTRVLSAIEMKSVCETYIRRRAIRHLEKNRIVIFAAGSGNPFFTTDTAAALRAVEMGCEMFFKATNVDGVYDKDPKKHKDAKRLDKLSYEDVIKNNILVMDQTAITLTKENDIPIIVFSLHGENTIVKAVDGEKPFSIISK